MYENVISLGIGEPDLDTPEKIVQAGCEALKSGKTHYTANAGIIELRKEISKFLKNNHIEYNPEKEIIVTTGAMGALSMSLMVILEEGDEVLIQDPQWLNYKAQVKFFGGKPIPVPVYEKNEFKLTAKDIEKRITDKTKAIMINTPNNPTGAVLDYEELESIAELAIKNDLMVIADEVYHTLVYDGQKHYSIASLKGMKDRTITINSFSKSFAMTGWRVGYAAGSEKIIDKMIKLQENLVACVSTSGQYGAVEALKNYELTKELKEIFLKRRNLIVEQLNNIKGISCIVPKGSFYLFLNIKETGMTSKEFAEDLLEKEKVITIPGSAFGEMGEGYLRIAYTLKEEKLTEAAERIKTYVENLNLRGD